MFDHRPRASCREGTPFRVTGPSPSPPRRGWSTTLTFPPRSSVTAVLSVCTYTHYFMKSMYLRIFVAAFASGTAIFDGGFDTLFDMFRSVQGKGDSVRSRQRPQQGGHVFFHGGVGGGPEKGRRAVRVHERLDGELSQHGGYCSALAWYVVVWCGVGCGTVLSCVYRK